MDLYHFNEPHPLHQYLLIVGGSSESRKTSAIKRAARLAEPVLNQFSQRGQRVWWPAVSSPEGIMEELSREPNRLLCLSEWTEMHGLSQKGGYWKHSTELWNLIYDATDSHRSRAKDNSIKIERPRVTILGASTPSLIESTAGVMDWLAGKMARYLIACETRPSTAIMDAPAEYPDRVHSLRLQLDTLARPIPDRGAMTLSDAAWTSMRDWQASAWWRALMKSAPEHVAPSFGRAQEHTFRLAAAYEASASFPWGPMQVTAPSIEAAIRVVEWCYDSLLKTFATIGTRAIDIADKNGLQRVTTLLSVAGEAGMSRSELLRASKLTAHGLEVVLGTLQQRFEIKVQKYNSGTRTGIRYWYVHDTE